MAQSDSICKSTNVRQLSLKKLRQDLLQHKNDHTKSLTIQRKIDEIVAQIYLEWLNR